MKNFILLFSALVIVILSALLWHSCDPKDNTELARMHTAYNNANNAKEVYKKLAESKDLTIDSLEKETKRLSSKKAKIVYRTKFDTLATIDTVLIELVKCDSVVRISDSIIALKDESIQSHVEKAEYLYDALNECENAQAIQDSIINSEQNKVKRIKRNASLKSSIIVILNVASIASPPTAIITTGLSIIVAILPVKTRLKKPK